MRKGKKMTQEFDAELVNKVMKKMQAVQELFDTEARDLTNAALSVIAPHYEKQISDLKSQITQWNDDMEAAPLKTRIDIAGLFNTYWNDSKSLIRLCDIEFFNDHSRKPHNLCLNDGISGHFQPTHWMLSPRLPELPLSPPKTAESEE